MQSHTCTHKLSDIVTVSGHGYFDFISFTQWVLCVASRNLVTEHCQKNKSRKLYIQICYRSASIWYTEYSGVHIKVAPLGTATRVYIMK